MLIKFTRTILIFAFLISILFLNADTIFAQNEDTEALFKRGVILFKQGKYVSASLDFKDIINNYSSSPHAISSHMMLAKSFFNLGDFERAVSTALEHRDKYPYSPYAEWTYYLIAACKFRMGEINQAVSMLSDLAAKTYNNTLRLRSLSAIKYAILPVADKGIVYKTLEEKGINLSDFDKVKPFDTFADQNKLVDISPDLSPVQQKIKWEGSSTIKIGLLSPLTGINSDLGNHLLKGVQAVMITNSSVDGKRIELIVEDTESDPVTAVLKTRKLIEEGVIAIIGPVLSEATISAAVESQARGIPFIAPTTTNVGFTRIGRYVFQLNFNPVIQAEALAIFAVDSLNFSNFAMITDNDPWGVAVAETVSREMEKRGAFNIWTDYLSSDLSLSSQDIFANIREHAPQSQAVMDSMVIFDYGNAFPDTVFLKQDIFPSDERRPNPIYSIDCIFVSATSEDAIRIASLIMEYNINTVILGDSGWWSNKKVFTGSEKYIEGAFIIAPDGELSGGTGLSYFNDVAGSSDTHNVLLMKGADACKLLIHCFQNGARDPDELVEMLESIKNFQGISSRITIDPERHTNKAVNFIRIQDGRYISVDKKNIFYQTEKFTEDAYNPVDNSIPANP